MKAENFTFMRLALISERPGDTLVCQWLTAFNQCRRHTRLRDLACLCRFRYYTILRVGGPSRILSPIPAMHPPTHVADEEDWTPWPSPVPRSPGERVSSAIQFMHPAVMANIRETSLSGG